MHNKLREVIGNKGYKYHDIINELKVIEDHFNKLRDNILYSFINPLFTNRTLANNIAQVNDDQVQQWLEEAAIELDLGDREELYNKIQKRIVEKLHTHAWLANKINFDAYDSDLRGYKANSYDLIYFYDCEWKSEPTYQVDLSSPPNINYTEGTTGHNITSEITDYFSLEYFSIM